MSHKKQTKQTTKPTFYAVTIKCRTVNEFIDSFGNVTPANTEMKVTYLAVGAKGIETVLNTFMSIDQYIFDEVKFKPLTDFKGNDGDTLFDYTLVI